MVDQTSPNAPGGPLAGLDAGGTVNTTTATFSNDVIQESMKVPVLVDFWAPWCEPCKQLAPVLEKIVALSKGAVKLVKMDIDENPEVAGQLGIKSIPAVIAFKNGQPLDGFMGAVPESQILAFIERIAGPIGPSETDLILEQGEALLGEENWAEAARAFAAVLESEGEAENSLALSGLVRAYIGAGDLDEAEATLARVTEADADKAEVAAARAALELARQSEGLGDIRELEAKVEANPLDHDARVELAIALSAVGKREDAVDHLIESVLRDRAYNEEAARKQLLQFFEAWGPKDEMTLYGRRRLSSVLFS